MTEVGRLFQMAGTAELKARPLYAVLMRGAWSRGRVDKRNVIVTDEPRIKTIIIVTGQAIGGYDRGRSRFLVFVPMDFLCSATI